MRLVTQTVDSPATGSFVTTSRSREIDSRAGLGSAGCKPAAHWRRHSGEEPEVAVEPHAAHTELVVEPDEVGAFAGLDGAEFGGAAELAGGIQGSHPYCVNDGCAAELHGAAHGFDHGKGAAGERGAVFHERGVLRHARGHSAYFEGCAG